MPLPGNKMKYINSMLNDAQSVKKATDGRGMSQETHYKTNLDQLIKKCFVIEIFVLLSRH